MANERRILTKLISLRGAVLLGRPILWGLAVDGEAGVRRVLELLHTEFDQTMGLCGCRNIGEITRDLIA